MSRFLQAQSPSLPGVGSMQTSLETTPFSSFSVNAFSDPIAGSVHAGVGSARASSFNSAVVSDPGSSLADAYKAGTLNGTLTFTDSVGDADPIDIYRFRLTGTNSLNLSLTGLSSDADVVILNRWGETIAGSNYGSSHDEAINLNSLEAGTYYAQVYQFSGDTDYTLHLSNNLFSNLSPTEVEVGSLRTTQTFSNIINSGNTADVYHFTLDTISDFNLSLVGLSNDIDVRLGQDLNGNGIFDDGETIAGSYRGFSADESVNLAALAAGSYFVQVYQYFGDSNYVLNLSTANPSNLLPTELDLGTLNGTQTYYNWISSSNTADVFGFNLATASDFNLLLTGLTNDADVRLIQDFNNNQVVDAFEEVAFSDQAGTIDESLNITGLAAGNYLVQVYQYSGDTTYSLNLTATSPNVPSDGAGNTLATAYNIGALTTTQTFSDFVGATDTFDFYSFSVDTTSTFNLSLDGLTSDADAYVIQDRNSNGIVDDFSEVVAYSAQGGANAEAITTGLAAGTYYIGIYQYSGDTNYNLSVSATPLALPSGYDPNFGYGLVDAAAAVASALGQTPFADVTNLGGNNWGLDLIHAPEVWNQGYTGEGITVAVIDTGVDYNHVDLNDNIWINTGEIAGNGIDDDSNGYVDDVRGWDFVDNDNDPMDLNEHGTHVAGTIAAEDNGLGALGVAYNATIMPVRVLDATGAGYDAAIADGIRYAADNGADVINLSLGGGGFSDAMASAIQYATEQGTVVVFAAGNEGAGSPSFPANLADQWGIAVGAVDSSNTLADFSNRAGFLPVDYVVAPGVNVYSTTPGNTYQSFNGTSMAAPHVAGVVALLLSANPDLTPEQVETILTETADPTGVTV